MHLEATLQHLYADYITDLGSHVYKITYLNRVYEKTWRILDVWLRRN